MQSLSVADFDESEEGHKHAVACPLELRQRSEQIEYTLTTTFNRRH